MEGTCTESALCHSSERGRAAEREVSGEVEGERQGQWGGEERDRKVKMERHRKTQKKGDGGKGRQTETHPERTL